MERSTVQVLAKRGKSQRQIAKELGRNRRTIARALREPVDQGVGRRQRGSQVDVYRERIEQWLTEGLPVVRMLELVRGDAAAPYCGSRSQFGEMVRRLRGEREHEQAMREVPLRFEGLPGEYLQVDWGEVRRLPLTQGAPGTRYFLACRLKYSRWVWLRWTTDMRQETLVRGLTDCLVALGWVPWVLVFDNMKTVTSGRDRRGQPLWTPTLLSLAGECAFCPQACDPGAPEQKGTVEALVKWVKGNFLPGRTFADDADLQEQTSAWCLQANTRVCDATGAPPLTRLPQEAAAGGVLPAGVADYALPAPGRVSAEALVAVRGNRYSVPLAQVGAPVTIRLHRDRVRIWRDQLCLADHRRARDGARQRIIDPTHFAPLFARKPRGAAMLYREVLLGLGGVAPAFLAALSFHQRAHLPEELRVVYALGQTYGTADLLAAMVLADEAGAYSAAALALLLPHPAPGQSPLPVLMADQPPQAAVDRPLAVYEAWVHRERAAVAG
ncbi:MAG: IS21 family transposase [Chloroflexota bacterium]